MTPMVKAEAGLQELRRPGGPEGHRHWRSARARCCCWSARPARASRRSCAASTIWSRSTPAGCYVDGELIGYRERGAKLYEMSPT